MYIRVVRKHDLLYYLLLCCSLFMPDQGRAVPANPDSLRKAISECPPDTHKVSLMIKLARQLTWMEPDEGLALAGDAVALALELGDGNGWISARLAEANIQTNRGEFDLAEKNLQEVLATVEHLGRDEDIGSVSFQLGIVAYSKSAYHEAIDHYEKALAFLKKEDKIGACHSNLALAYRGIGDDAAYLSQMFAALDLFKKMDAPFRQASVFNNLAVYYSSIGEFEKALSYAQASLDLFAESENSQAKVTCLATLGSIYESLGEESKALQAFRESVSLAEELGLKYDLGVALHHMGNHYLKRKKYSQAEKQLMDALDLFYEAAYYQGKVAVSRDLARMYNRQGKVNSEIEYLHLAMDIIKEEGEPEELPEIYQALAYAYEEGGYYSYAMEYRLKADEAQIEMSNDSKARELARVEAEQAKLKTDIEAKVREQEMMLEREMRKRQLMPWKWLLMGLGILFLAAMAVLIVLRSNRKS